jgi:FdhD protein
MQSNTITVPVRTIEGEHGKAGQELLAVEEPLEIRLNGETLAITMRTPGHDADLARGYLFTEGIVERSDQLLSMRHDTSIRNPRRATNTLLVQLSEDVVLDRERVGRSTYINSSCGVCGKMSIETLEARVREPLPKDQPVFTHEAIHGLPDALRRSQAVFERTGGLHAAGLFASDGRLLLAREDIGRHNAVDKLIGAAMTQAGRICSNSLMLVSGRAGFELVQKALMAGIPILAAVGAPSSLAVETAQRFGMTLLGFVRGSRFHVYSGSSRIQ